jgi:hypothetical protein
MRGDASFVAIVCCRRRAKKRFDIPGSGLRRRPVTLQTVTGNGWQRNSGKGRRAECRLCHRRKWSATKRSAARSCFGGAPTGVGGGNGRIATRRPASPPQIRKIGAGSFGAAWLYSCRETGEQVRPTKGTARRNRHTLPLQLTRSRLSKAALRCGSLPCAQVVIKKVQLHGLTDEERRKARAEAGLLARLTHPCVLRHIESFEDAEGHLCIVTEFCERGDLDSALARARGVPLPEPRVLDLFAQLALALLFLHKRKVGSGRRAGGVAQGQPFLQRCSAVRGRRRAAKCRRWWPPALGRHTSGSGHGPSVAARPSLPSRRRCSTATSSPPTSSCPRTAASGWATLASRGRCSTRSRWPRRSRAPRITW